MVVLKYGRVLIWSRVRDGGEDMPGICRAEYTSLLEGSCHSKSGVRGHCIVMVTVEGKERVLRV